MYENISFVIPLDKKLDNLFHNKLVSCVSFANGAIFGHPSSFLTPSKKAKLSWAYFPQDSRGFVCEIFCFQLTFILMSKVILPFSCRGKKSSRPNQIFYSTTVELLSSLNFEQRFRKLPQLKSNDLHDREYTSRVIDREQKIKHVIAVRSEPPIGKTFSTLDLKSLPVLQLLIYFKALSWLLFGI